MNLIIKHTLNMAYDILSNKGNASALGINLNP